MIGRTIAHYRVTEKIGAGGMGEVYQATDTKLNREVALKVLPEAFARDADRMARFKREAQVLASLNHPNIAAIYGLEQQGDTHALVLELVEGPTLADRIKEGALSLDEALQIAKQIAEALESAHEQGVIHRDLKPANVKVREDSQVKVLDFGLAKALEAEQSPEEIANSPTLSIAATKAGIILGTAAYMSPEQAKGRKANRKADVWSFGVVLFEMLTGRRLFEGETISDILARVIEREPDWSLLPEKTPPSILKLLKRSLTKDRRQRLGDIGEARYVIEEYISNPAGSDAATEAFPQPEGKTLTRERLLWASGVALASLLAVLGWLAPQQGDAGAPVHSEITAPRGGSFAPVTFGSADLSPDGTQLAFVAAEGNELSLWVRRLDSGETFKLKGTGGAIFPFWAPDNRRLGFFADAQLKKIDVVSGTVDVLAEAPNGRGGTWNREGTILFAPDLYVPLYRVSASGGPAEPVTGEAFAESRTHRMPHFLPDGETFLLVNGSASEEGLLMAGSLSSGELQEVAEWGSAVIYDSSSGNLLYVREGNLLAQAFNPSSLAFTGEPAIVASGVEYYAPRFVGNFSVSEDGLLVYRLAEQVQSEAVWADPRNGTVSPLPKIGNASISGARVSPDGEKVALLATEMDSRRTSLWMLDRQTGATFKLTDDMRAEGSLSWSPDGSRLATSGGVNPVRILDPENGTVLSTLTGLVGRVWDWTPDGSNLVASSQNVETGWDVFAIPVSGEGERRYLANTPAQEVNAALSPDGRFLSYDSDQSGQLEIYVTDFPEGKARWQVSRSGGTIPLWSRDGRKLYFNAAGGKVMSVAVQSGGGFRFGEPAPVPIPGPNLGAVGALPDGRLLVIRRTGERVANPFHLVTHWRALLNND